MKKLLALFAAIALVAITASGDVTKTVSSLVNVRVTLVPNGQLDGAPTWTLSGPGTLQVDPGGFGALLVTAVGTNTITVTAASQGNPLTETVTVIVFPAPPPATALGASAVAVPK